MENKRQDERNISNEELARDLGLVIEYHDHWGEGTKRRAMEGVKKCPYSLEDHYLEHGNFTEVSLPGVGDKTKEMLERIIEEGRDAYIARVQREDIDRFSRKHIRRMIGERDREAKERRVPWEKTDLFLEIYPEAAMLSEEDYEEGPRE